MSIKIITDSTCDLSKKLIVANDIEVLPLSVNFGEESFRDGVDISSEVFFDRLRQAKVLPFTSQVNPAQFEVVFRRLLDDGHEIMGIFIAATLSGTYNSAILARQSFSEAEQKKIHLFDAKTSTVQLGLIVLEAAKAVAEGLKCSQIAERIIYGINHSKIILMMDTLEYLSKGGRLTASQAVIGNLLNIKPILTVEDGEIITLDKVRGRKKALKWIVDWVNHKGINPLEQPFILVHGDDLDNLDALKNHLGERYQEKLDYELCIGAVIGTHLGPGCVGIAYID